MFVGCVSTAGADKTGELTGSGDCRPSSETAEETAGEDSVPHEGRLASLRLASLGREDGGWDLVLRGAAAALPISAAELQLFKAAAARASGARRQDCTKCCNCRKASALRLSTRMVCTHQYLGHDRSVFSTRPRG